MRELRPEGSRGAGRARRRAGGGGQVCPAVLSWACSAARGLTGSRGGRAQGGCETEAPKGTRGQDEGVLCISGEILLCPQSLDGKV